MKKLALLFATVAIALLGLPGLLGKLAQEQLENQVELTQDNPVILVSIGDYDRSWFSSTVRYEIGLTDEYLEIVKDAVAGDDLDQDKTKASSLDESLLNILSPFEMVSDVSHGPIGFLDGPFLGLFKSFTTESANNPRLNEFLADANMPYLIKGYSVTNLLGSTAFNFEMPPSQRTEDGDSLASKLNFSGATGKGNVSTTDSGEDRIQVTTNMKNLSLKEEDSEFTMSDFNVITDSTKVSEMLWSGRSTTTIGLLTVKDNSREDRIDLSMQDSAMAFESALGDTQQTLNGEVEYRVAEIQIAGLTIADIKLAVAANELSIPAIEKYNQWTQELALTPSDESDAARRLNASLPVMHQFLSTSPTISLDPITFSMNDETFLADITLNINGKTLPAIDSFDFMDIALWMKMVSGKAGLSLSENMATLLAITSSQRQLQTVLGDQQGITPEQISQMAAAQAPILINTLVQQGMLKSAGGQISAGITFDNGELLLNGQPLPVEAILGL